MKMIAMFNRITLIIGVLMISLQGMTQISPGELAKVHAHLEGLSNCTQCHTLGAKVSNEKCLACHKEIKSRLEQSKGFHASVKVKSKDCTVCHSDHYGKNFDIVHLQKDKFDHSDTGYLLEGKHTKKDCKDCHIRKNISDSELNKKQVTYLGLNDQCATCHEDVHLKSLSVNCQNCHNVESFKPAAKFNHSKTKYQLRGKHTDVACQKCHPVTIRNGKNFQQFAAIQFQNCVNCHKDPHENKFGQNCSQCHTEESFKTVKSLGQFDHSKTGYLLQGRHVQVACKLCHKTGLTDPVKHEKCVDCHKDYHNNQFNKQDRISDCSECHDVKGFDQFSFSTEKHNLSKFKLEGSHLATPCFECHKKAKEWNFRSIGEKCVDCHKDPHLNLIGTKFYPAGRCENCHRVVAWSEIKFDHQQTTFPLDGKHAVVSCRKCHFESKSIGLAGQKFNSLAKDCEACHTDVHHDQFKEGDKSFCERCHSSEDWKPVKFNHNSTRFKLDGGHKDVACIRCHKVLNEGGVKYINYKFKDILCATCHL